MKPYAHALNIELLVGKMIAEVGALIVIPTKRRMTMSDPDFEIDQEWIDAWEGSRIEQDKNRYKPESLKYSELPEYKE